MAIPKIDEQNITSAIKYIDEHGIPDKDKSTQYVLVTEEGKQYPPKYVIAVANHIANGVDIVTDGYNAVEAKNYFETRGYNIESKQEKLELTISAEKLVSTDTRFTIEYLEHKEELDALAEKVVYTGPIDAYFVKADGENITRVNGEIQIRHCPDWHFRSLKVR